MNSRVALLPRWMRRAAGAPLLAALVALSAPVVPTPALAAQDQPLELVSAAWSPFTNEPGKERFALDLVDEALERAGFRVEHVIVEDSDLASLQLNREYDGSASAWRDPRRERVMVYSEPYLENRLILVGRRGSDVSATSLADLAGKRVALVSAWSYGDLPDGPAYVPSEGDEDSLQKLLTDEADYTLMDDLVVQYLVAHFGAQVRGRLEFGTAPLLTRSLHVAVHGELPDAEALIAGFNSELPGMIADGAYHRLLQVHWMLADVDGDGVREYVCQGDEAGTEAPERPYVLFAAADPAADAGADPRFYISGNFYDDWATVPERHKVAVPEVESSADLKSFFSSLLRVLRVI